MRVAEVSISPEFKVDGLRALFAMQEWFPRFTVAADGRVLFGRDLPGASSWRLMLLDGWCSLLPRS